ncbi:prokaryotic transcription elongation factor, GreA/GreB domain protein [Cupriavidus sp. TA19]|uniref:GreA/GreB family elongation factor n=1 Tax=unclassified Cupriavidus TaxID=2640874 RepID=UPI000E2F43C6|nr:MULTISPECIES: GreA/GreB family elongation factor [unclassified Cupriavidus]BDB29723.1 GreA/GreB family elongation factor [Cupriavidus sp. P-10]GLC94418.1 prokaryotic transcription elongation factor, GreA/GreB domain protein [Cupriavidus sp. TA19]
MRKTIFLTTAHIERLNSLVLDQGLPTHKRQCLRDMIEHAIICTHTSLPAKAITLHTPFLCIEAHHREHLLWRIVYPEDADYRQGKLSILSPAGMALFGLHEGQHVRVAVPESLNFLEITVEEILESERIH